MLLVQSPLHKLTVSFRRLSVTAYDSYPYVSYHAVKLGVSWSLDVVYYPPKCFRDKATDPCQQSHLWHCLSVTGDQCSSSTRSVLRQMTSDARRRYELEEVPESEAHCTSVPASIMDKSSHSVGSIGPHQPIRKPRVALACKRCKRRKQRVSQTRTIMFAGTKRFVVVRWRASYLSRLRAFGVLLYLRTDSSTPVSRWKNIVSIFQRIRGHEHTDLIY